MGKSGHLFVAMVVALLASVGALVTLPIGPVQGAANLPPGFTDSQVVSGLTNPTDMEFAQTAGSSWPSRRARCA